VGNLPNLSPETVVTVVTQAAAPVVNLVEDGAEAAGGAFANLSADLQAAAADSYDKVSGWLAGLGATAEEYADALEQLTPDQFDAFMTFVSAVDRLKEVRSQVQGVHGHFDGVTVKDFLSGEHKAYAYAVADGTATFVNLSAQIVGLLNGLIGLFGDRLKDALRAQPVPMVKQQINLG